MKCPDAQLGMFGVCSCFSHNGFLTRRGYEMVSSHGVDKAEAIRYLDGKVSVSGLRRDETTMIFDDGVINEQFERFSSPQGSGS